MGLSEEDFTEEEIQELVDIALRSLAESLRDQAAMKAENGEDISADALRVMADRVEP